MYNVNLQAKILILTFVISVSFSNIKAQRKSLIFSEVYFNKNNPEINWVEISNISDKQLTLKRVRFDGIKTLNILPPKIKKQGGININPNHSIILCSSKNMFNRRYSTDTKVIEVKCLAGIGKGGYIVLWSNKTEKGYTDAFRYGQKDKSKEYTKKLGDYVLPYTEGKSSCIRKYRKNQLQKSSKQEIHPIFKKAKANPGKLK